MLSWATMDSPLGALLLIGSDRGLVRIAFEQEGFESVRLRVAQVLHEDIHEGATALLDLAKRQLTEYFAGERQSFDLPLDRCLSKGFFAEVQAFLSTIPFGETMSYSQLAAATGHPKAHRAAANACAANPLPFIQACHRITRSDGTFGGYRGGIEAKQFLLDCERQGASSAL